MGVIFRGKYLAIPPKAVRHLNSHRPEKARKGLEDIKIFLAKEGLDIETYIEEALRTILAMNSGHMWHKGKEIAARPVVTTWREPNSYRGYVTCSSFNGWCEFKPISMATIRRLQNVNAGRF